MQLYLRRTLVRGDGVGAVGNGESMKCRLELYSQVLLLLL